MTVSNHSASPSPHPPGASWAGRSSRWKNWLQGFGRDLRLAARSLIRAPGFAAAAIATITLCLGPNIAILTLLYALVLKPQPFAEPERLVQVVNSFDKLAGGASRQLSNPVQFRDFQAQADLFEGFAMMQYFGTTIGETLPERGTGMRVDAGFFPLLGLQPLVGRFGAPKEDVEGRDRVLVLTETFWRSRYGSDPSVVGQSLRVNGEPWTVIGVAPKSVEVLDPYTMFFKPFERLASEENPRARFGSRTVVYGRLKPGVSLEAAQAQLGEIERRYVTDHASPAERARVEATGHRITLERVGAAQAAALRSPLTMLQAGAAFVLLIGVVNVLNLILARTNAKRPELAIRQALGAGRAVLLRQLFAEMLLLTGSAAVLGLGLAWACLQLINRYLPLVAAKATPVGLDAPIIAGILLAALILAVVLGLAPFLFLARSRISVADSRTASATPAARAFGHSLVIAQVAFALVLLIGAGLLLRSFIRVTSVDLGFDAARVVQGRVAVPIAVHEGEKNVAFQRRLLEALREIPGVESVSLVAEYAIGKFRTMPFVLQSAPTQLGENQPIASVNWVSPDFFATLGIALVEGRLFAETDDMRSGRVLIIDDVFAKRYFPGRSPVGEGIALGTEPPPEGVPWPRIVGVVKRAQLSGPEARDGLPFLYGPMVQQPAPGVTFLVRTSRPTADTLNAMRLKLREIDPTLPLYWTASLQEGLDGMLQYRRGVLLLIAAFAVLALVLAAVGLYGVLAYDVSQRTREIGIRGAIGATRGQLVGMILQQGLWKTGVGLLVGLVLAAYLTRFLHAMLFDVGRFDAVTFLGIPLLLSVVALAACWLPARRAARVDPIVALRAE